MREVNPSARARSYAVMMPILLALWVANYVNGQAGGRPSRRFLISMAANMFAKH